MVLPILSPDQIESRTKTPFPSKNGVNAKRLQIEIRIAEGNWERLTGVVRINGVLAAGWIECNLADFMAVAQKRKFIGLRKFFKVPVSADGNEGLGKKL